MTAFRAAIEKAPIVPVLTVYEADHAEPLAEALAMPDGDGSTQTAAPDGADPLLSLLGDPMDAKPPHARSRARRERLERAAGDPPRRATRRAPRASRARVDDAPRRPSPARVRRDTARARPAEEVFRALVGAPAYPQCLRRFRPCLVSRKRDPRRASLAPRPRSSFPR